MLDRTATTPQTYPTTDPRQSARTLIRVWYSLAFVPRRAPITMVHEVICAEAGMDCSFEVRSEDEDELVEIVQFHARESHGSEIQRIEVEDLMHEV